MRDIPAAPEPTSLQPEGGLGFQFEVQDQPFRELREFDRTELESLRGAVERILARIAAGEQQGRNLSQDVTFTCEWWPPDESS